MQDPQAAQGATRVGARAETNGRPVVPVRPVDRSHLLRRPSQFPFRMPYSNGKVRIRRERRVFESFSAIRSLSRREKN